MQIYLLFAEAEYPRRSQRYEKFGKRPPAREFIFGAGGTPALLRMQHVDLKYIA